MTDIIDEIQSAIGTGGSGVSTDLAMRSKNEIKRLREALQEISNLSWWDEMLGPKIARAALKEKE